FLFEWRETSASVCGTAGPNPKTCPFTNLGSSGIQQQAFAACNELVVGSCADPNQSGPIILAQIGVVGNTTVGSLQGGTQHLVIKVELKGLQNAQPGDPATVLRYSTGSSSTKQTGLIDCGQGNGTGGDQGAILSGCPVVGTPDC